MKDDNYKSDLDYYSIKYKKDQWCLHLNLLLQHYSNFSAIYWACEQQHLRSQHQNCLLIDNQTILIDDREPSKNT